MVHSGFQLSLFIGTPFFCGYPYPYWHTCFGPPLFYQYPCYPSYFVEPPVVIVNHYARRTAPAVVVRGVGRVGDELIVERVNGNLVRLTWQDDSKPIQELEMFLADAEQRVLAAQTLRAAPFAALFDPSPLAAYVGMSVAYADGTKVTTLIPYDFQMR